MAKNFLIIINDAPYGNERPYNAMRLAFNLVKKKPKHRCASSSWAMV